MYFEEVGRHAEVWLNGRKIGSNSDPYGPFSLTATWLRAGARNLLIVRVDNLVTPGSFFQDWWNWGGIVRPVTLEAVGRISLADLGVMPELGCHDRCGEWLIEGTLINHTRVPLRPVISVKSSSPDGVTTTSTHRMRSIGPGGSVAVSFRVRVVGRPDLWSPGHPALYRVRVATIAQRRVEQLKTLRTGLRSVQVRDGVLYLGGYLRISGSPDRTRRSGPPVRGDHTILGALETTCPALGRRPRPPPGLRARTEYEAQVVRPDLDRYPPCI